MPKTNRPADQTPVTFDAIARKRISESLSMYRDEVARAADGEPQTEKQLCRVIEVLAALGIPESEWAADVSATREFNTYEVRRIEEEDAQPAYHAEGKRLAAEIDEVEKRLKELKAQQYAVGRRPHRLVAAVQRLEELKRQRPHLFLPLDVATERRLAMRANAARSTSGIPSASTVPAYS